MKLKKLIMFLEMNLEGLRDLSPNKEISNFKIEMNDIGINCIISSEKTRNTK